MTRLLPDWVTPDRVILAWTLRRRRLAQFYRNLLTQLVRDGVPVTVVAPRDAQALDMIESVQCTDTSRITHFRLPTLKDIWIRDWAPLVATTSSGEMVALKPRYAPQYLASSEAAGDDAAGAGIAQVASLTSEPLLLKWDLGNLTHNGQGVAIVTRRIAEDNPHLGEKGVRKVLKERAGIKRLLLIKEEPEDVTGHVDGMVRFLSERTVAVGAYPRSCEEKPFMDRIARRVESELGREFQVIRLANEPPEDRVTEGMPSATGNYLNFLRVGATFYVPSYGRPADEAAARDLAAAMPRCKIVRVPALELARLGGVLNCISWVLPERKRHEDCVRPADPGY